MGDAGDRRNGHGTSDEAAGLGLPRARSDGAGPGPRPDGSRPDGEVPLPRVERTDAPAYLRRYHERRATGGSQPVVEPLGGGADVDGHDRYAPLYLRRYRTRDGSGDGRAPLASPAGDADAPTWTEAWAATTKSPDLVLPPEAAPPRTGASAVVDVHLVRHGETQGYSVNAGLTPLGRWQAHRRGHDLSKSIRDGEHTRLVCAPTPRAMQTAEQLRRGIEEGLALWARSAPVEGPFPMEEFRNFAVRTPSGEVDVTSAFREYHVVAERYERIALGDRPLWLVEMDRFIRLLQGGGDPIHHWMTMPLLTFEPAAAVVLRFWAGIARAVSDTPDGGRVVVATHSGPIRALATWALGHDPGEPYNVEEVRVKVRRTLDEAQVTYRNRTAEIHLPPADQQPSWWGSTREAIPVEAEAPGIGGARGGTGVRTAR